MTEDPLQPAANFPVPPRKKIINLLWFALRVLLVCIFLLGVWFGGSSLLSNHPISTPEVSQASAPTAIATFDFNSVNLPDLLPIQLIGIPRQVQLHTILPSRPRFEITKYTIEKGDTIFAIAEKFGLKTQSILWGNYETLGDDPDLISPGVELVILPVDGAYHKWREGEGLTRVSEYYHVTPEDIINWPGNHLTNEAVGDFAKPNINPGTMLIIPGGRREFVSKVPTVQRKNPGVASYLGPGSCSSAGDGAVGTGSFTWPVVGTITNPFSPETNHPALDIAVPLGTGIAAADTGVVVYAGATYDSIGYGNLVIIDHGNGWQTLYAHQGTIYVSCGQGIFKGATIGTVGMTGRTTGPHLHFEMRSDSLGKVNPFNFLQ